MTVIQLLNCVISVQKGRGDESVVPEWNPHKSERTCKGAKLELSPMEPKNKGKLV